MISQVILPPKSFATNVAGERSFIRVRPFVDHHVVGFSKLSMAKLADEPLLWLGKLSLAQEESGVVGGKRASRVMMRWRVGLSLLEPDVQKGAL